MLLLLTTLLACEEPEPVLLWTSPAEGWLYSADGYAAPAVGEELVLSMYADEHNNLRFTIWDLSYVKWSSGGVGSTQDPHPISLTEDEQSYLFIASGYLHSHDLKLGDYEYSNFLFNAPQELAVDEGYVYAGRGAGEWHGTTYETSLIAAHEDMYAFEAPLPDLARTLAVGLDGTVYVLTESSLHAFTSAHDHPPLGGEQLWGVQLQSTGRHLAVGVETLVVSLSNAVAVYAREDGDLLWVHPMWGPAEVTIAASGAVYASGEEALVCLDGTTGEVAWRREGPAGPTALGSDGHLRLMLVREGEWRFAVVDGSSGEVLWEATPDFEVDDAPWAPALSGGRTYYTAGGRIAVWSGAPDLAHGPWPRQFADNGNRSKELPLPEHLQERP